MERKRQWPVFILLAAEEEEAAVVHIDGGGGGGSRVNQPAPTTSAPSTGCPLGLSCG